MSRQYLDTLTSPRHDEGNPMTSRGPSNDEAMPAVSGERACLSNDEVLAFAQGRLDRGLLDAMHVHVDLCLACQHLLGEAVHALNPDRGQETDDLVWNTIFRPDTMVGQRYRIERFLARGGMGEVYEAYDCQLYERVALKTVTSTACDSLRAVRRLKTEVQLARRVSHPNVCRIFDIGKHALEHTGAVVHFLTMEFVEGESLGERLRRGGPLPLRQAEAVARGLLEGLGAAHRAGVLHRDLKSDNVILCATADDQLRPVILDFGLARSLSTGSNPGTSAPGQGLIGTLGYMAPEQIEGRPLSAASDIYAFGVVWFEMLTGHLPFEADTAAAGALARLHQEPTPPRTLNHAIPKSLERIVLRCLRRSIEERYSSAADILAALDAISESHPESTPMHRPTLVAVASVAASAVLLAAAARVLPSGLTFGAPATLLNLTAEEEVSPPEASAASSVPSSAPPASMSVEVAVASTSSSALVASAASMAAVASAGSGQISSLPTPSQFSGGLPVPAQPGPPSEMDQAFPPAASAPSALAPAPARLAPAPARLAPAASASAPLAPAASAPALLTPAPSARSLPLPLPLLPALVGADRSDDNRLPRVRKPRWENPFERRDPAANP